METMSGQTNFFLEGEKILYINKSLKSDFTCTVNVDK